VIIVQEELIEKLINIEQKAQELQSDGAEQIKKLEEKYQKRMEKERKLKLEKTKEEGEKIVQARVEKAEEFSKNMNDESSKELERISRDYKEIKPELMKKYYKKITGFGGEE